MPQVITNQVKDNRRVFLTALRSSEYPKGPIEIDAGGHPANPNTTGFCVGAVAYALFHDDQNPGSLVPTRAALGLTRKQFTHYQQDWNDSPRTFAEIADLIEEDMFNEGEEAHG